MTKAPALGNQFYRDGIPSRFGDALLSRALSSRLRLMIGLIGAIAILCVAGQAAAQQAPTNDADLEDLVKVEVTSVSKKEEQLFRAPSAIYVLTRADIRRSGATSIPEVLRLVPGLSVAQIDAHEWAVTSRGFNGLRSNKLLVLIDGRSIYSPVFSGVYWDIQTLPMEDIERIEVIRGPGGTVWGANAVNGTINIISREAFDTQGGYGTLGSGSLERGFASFRYGSTLGKKSYYRVFGRYFQRGGLNKTGPTQNAGDGWNLAQGGFRADLRPGRNDSLTLMAATADATLQQQSMTVTGVGLSEASSSDGKGRAQNVSMNWTHTRSPRSVISLRVSYDQSRRAIPQIVEEYRTLDLDFQQRLAVNRRHDVVWGFEQRISSDHERGTYMVSFTPDRAREYLTTGFLQDEFTLTPHISVTGGTKLERDLRGISLQPNTRVSWTPTRIQNMWAAVSRARRTPTRADLDLRVNYATFPGPTGEPVVLSVFGNPDFQPEQITAFEAGHRVDLPLGVQLDTTAFRNSYSGLRHDVLTTFVETIPAPVHLVVGTRYENHDRAATTGVESAIRWNARAWWRLDASFSWLKVAFLDDGDDALEQVNGASPSRQFRVGSGTDLPWASRLDINLFHVGAVRAFDVPAYTRLDVRLNHEFSPRLSFGVVAQNLLDRGHVEFGTADGATAREIPRSAFLRLTWQF